MPSAEELQQAFNPYFAEIEACRSAQTYWALLHVLMALPDICSALESDNGEAKGSKYVDWCRRYCSLKGLTGPDEYWTIRSRVLHQGRTVTSLDGYLFSRPGAQGQRFHRERTADGVLVLDVDELAVELMKSIRDWFGDLQTPAAAARCQNVETHLPTLVRVQNRELPGSGGDTHVTSGTCIPTTTRIFGRAMP